MKFTIEIPDDTVHLIEKSWSVDMNKLIQNIMSAMIDNLSQIAIAQKAGVPLSVKKIEEIAHEIGAGLLGASKLDSKLEGEKKE